MALTGKGGGGLAVHGSIQAQWLQMRFDKLSSHSQVPQLQSRQG